MFSTLSHYRLAVIRKLQEHLENKTQHSFSLDHQYQAQVLVRSLTDLLAMAGFRSYWHYLNFYVSGAFETQDLKSLLSSLMKGRNQEETKDLISALLSLVETPQLWLSLLFDHDEHFLGYCDFAEKTDHLDFIAQCLNLNCCDHLLELGLSTGSGQLYLAQQAACHISSLTLSLCHEQKLRNIYAQYSYPLHLRSYDQILFDKTGEKIFRPANKIALQSFFEPFDLNVIKKVFSSTKQHAEHRSFYLQGLMRPGFDKLLEKNIPSVKIEQQFCFEKGALDWLERKQQQLYDYKDELEPSVYRVWRLYFVKRFLELKKQHYHFKAFKGTVQG